MKISKYLVSALLLLSTFDFPFSVKAQVRPVYDYGATGLAQLLKKLNTSKSVMHIGAHPDDEDSGLLAFLARGENARTAYLSLTRGDGGQNIIGAELFEPLGVIRTEELLQARRLDGAQQYFTRAFDYGFSKTLREAREKWDEKIILCDAVRAIRAFRPLVVVSRFSGTPADGHGQHQFAGYIAPLAVKAAADTTQCTDAGQAWKVQKFYVSQGFRDNQEPTLKINTGKYDYLLGRSYFEIAMEGRSQHKTQEQGVLELKGEKISGLNLIAGSVAKTEKETSIFDGLDTSIRGIAANTYNSEPAVAGRLAALQEITEKLNAPRLERENLLPLLAEGWKAAYDAEWSTRYPQTKFFLQKKQDEFAEAIRLAAGIQIDALADKETVVAGEDFRTTVKVFFPDAGNIKVKEIALNKPAGWQVSKSEAPTEANQNAFRREVGNENAYFNVKVPADAPLTQPYWMEKERNGYLYAWNDRENQTLPFQPALVSADVKIEVGGREIMLRQPVQYRFDDDIRGEIRRDLAVVPALSVSLDQQLVIVPLSGQKQTRRLVMSITNNTSQPVNGIARLQMNALRLDTSFKLKAKGEKTAINFDVPIPPATKAGSGLARAEVVVGESVSTDEMNVLAYPHIQTHRYYTRAETKFVALDLKTAPARRVGYIAGSGERVAEAIGQMGFDVEMLAENDLTSGDLSRFDAIVVGIKASQVRPDFVANHQRLLDYVRAGGTLIVQYQLPVYEKLLPFPAKIGARVAEETAKVTILDAANPVFNFPNKITDEDFAGWVQERNLNAFSTFDPNYKPLLEAHDTEEPENKGGLVVADLGKGKYIYCSYAFFRQLPAGVPGAYRLFANLLSQPKAAK
ncbi:MAG TPA: PIG-L family deacetylase [Pyrinomonadaceae bacterium]|jgi:LmbE family N-acetylglucosaminyl deacetylase